MQLATEGHEKASLYPVTHRRHGHRRLTDGRHLLLPTVKVICRSHCLRNFTRIYETEGQDSCLLLVVLIFLVYVFVEKIQ